MSIHTSMGKNGAQQRKSGVKARPEPSMTNISPVAPYPALVALGGMIWATVTLESPTLLVMLACSVCSLFWNAPSLFLQLSVMTILCS